MLLGSCGGGSLGGGKEMHLSDSKDILAIVKQVREKAGGKVMLDEATFYAQDKEGSDEINFVSFKYQDPKDANSILGLTYYPGDGRWIGPEKMEITVMGGNAEEYRVANDVADIETVKFDLIPKVIQDAKTHNQNDVDIKQIETVTVTCDENKAENTTFRVYAEGTLKANGVKKNVSYDADYQGLAQKD